MISGLDVVRATFNEAANSLSDVKVIFRNHPQTPNDSRSGVGTRSGGRIAFGKDGYIYMTVGDRDAGSSFPWRVAQTLDTDLGKIIRITRDGQPAPGNPFPASRKRCRKSGPSASAARRVWPSTSPASCGKSNTARAAATNST